MLVLPLCALLLSRPDPPAYDSAKLPYRCRWGSYTVLVKKDDTDTDASPFGSTVLRIISKSGKTAYTLRDARITAVESLDLKQHSLPALHVTTHFGGAPNFGYTDYLFTQDGSVQNVLIYEHDQEGLRYVDDLNRDGHTEIVADSDVLEQSSATSIAGHPDLTIVFAWNGRRYTAQTRRYPRAAFKAASEFRRNLIKHDYDSVNDNENPSVGDKSLSEGEIADIEGYYGNMCAIGKATEARQWILGHVEKKGRRFFLNFEDTLRHLVASASKDVVLTDPTLINNTQTSQNRRPKTPSNRPQIRTKKQ